MENSEIYASLTKGDGKDSMIRLNAPLRKHIRSLRGLAAAAFSALRLCTFGELFRTSPAPPRSQWKHDSTDQAQK